MTDILDPRELYQVVLSKGQYLERNGIKNRREI